jgi:hypothetical protein
MKPSRSELHDLLELWKVKRGDRRMPAWRDFAVPELQRWLGHLNLLEIVDGGADFRFRVYGTKITAAFGVDHETLPTEQQGQEDGAGVSDAILTQTSLLRSSSPAKRKGLAVSS